MIYAIIYSLFLGFGLTIGSDLAFLFLPNALRNSQNSPNQLSGILALHGQFTADNSTGLMSSFSGSFSFANTSMFAGQRDPESLLEGCVRHPQSIFLLQAFPGWTLILLVPFYSFISSLWNLQPLRSRQLPVMVLISCARYVCLAPDCIGRLPTDATYFLVMLRIKLLTNLFSIVQTLLAPSAHSSLDFLAISTPALVEAQRFKSCPSGCPS